MSENDDAVEMLLKRHPLREIGKRPGLALDDAVEVLHGLPPGCGVALDVLDGVVVGATRAESNVECAEEFEAWWDNFVSMMESGR